MRTGAHLATTLLVLLSLTFSALLLAGAGAHSEASEAGLQPRAPGDGLVAQEARTQADEGVGYEDTPFLPGGQWRVHDKHRPVPPVVNPGPAPLEPQAPPGDAIVLFDGRDTSAWQQGGKPIVWKVEGGALVVAGGGNIETRQAFGDCQLHVEFATPPADGDSQHRGNSGVFLMGRYEIQILDSYQNRTYADGQAGALYGQNPPLVNVCRAPGQWQTYDIVFKAPRFEGERLVSAGRVTVLHNGVLVQNDQEFIGATRHQEVATYAAHWAELPLQLQDHGNPMRFRNLWIRRL